MPIVEVAHNCFQVPLPLPFALNIVNCYLLRDDDGWSVVDAGLHTPAGEAAWRAAFAALNLEPQTIRQIVLTHFHPDHFGMAGWLQSLSAAPVLLAPRELEQAKAMWGKPPTLRDPLVPMLLAHGCPDALVTTIEATVADLRAATFPHPTVTPLLPGSHVQMGGRSFTAIHAPGHSDGQLIFYDADDRLLLSGDHVLNKITPHIGLWPGSEPDPLGRYLASLTDLATLEVRLALPGHKTLIADWPGRINELQHHHAERLAVMLAVVEASATSYEVACTVFPFARFTPHEQRFAIAETSAHLERLVLQGELERSENPVVRYHRVK